MMPRDRLLPSRGVTLVELVIALAVLAIVVTLVAPSWKGLLRRHHVNAAAEMLRSDLAYARHEAVQRASFVSICPSSTGDACATQAFYGDGWIVYAYPVGVAGANRAYMANAPGFSRLRRTVPTGSMAVTASDAGVVTFGQQGQFKSTSERATVSWRVCARASGDDPQGEASTDVPGVELILNGSGSLQRRQLAPDERCLPASS
ncbi:GspH/FimT family pseudopilin [Dyella jiangningensis]|uniref:Type II secretion system protein H n=1 Tax=Dyella jiangningensis TaxID=1379159 RepID=A0A328P2J5_9GAMM|nr:GspH/FimT family pseudopilin [Dyella jiangningensis]RAO75196.1 hypothetical protein CA260_13935 [Dyella jiangningensis]